MSAGTEETGRGIHHTGTQDPLVVYTEPLAVVLREWIRKHDAEHEPVDRFNPERYKPGKHGFVDRLPDDESMYWYFPSVYIETTARQYLEEKSGIDIRLVQHILSGTYVITSFRVADSLMTAMGLQIEGFEELTPVPNPAWGRERWEAWRIEHGGCD